MLEAVQYTFSLPTIHVDNVDVHASLSSAILRLPSTLPDPCRIVRAIMWAQNPLVFPGDARGDITLAVDPGSQYCQAAGFPAQQNPTDFVYYLKTIGVFEAALGAKRAQLMGHSPPVAYRASNNDCIVFAPELLGTPYAMDMYVGIVAESVHGDLEPPTWTTIYNAIFDTDVAGNNNISIRQFLGPFGSLPTFTQMRVHVSALASGCVLNHLSIGIQSGTGPNTAATPVELKFNGVNGISLGPNSGAWTDPLPFAFGAGDVLAITADLFNGQNFWAYKATVADSNYSTTVPSWNTAVMGGSPVFQVHRLHVIDQIQVS